MAPQSASGESTSLIARSSLAIVTTEASSIVVGVDLERGDRCWASWGHVVTARSRVTAASIAVLGLMATLGMIVLNHQKPGVGTVGMTSSPITGLGAPMGEVLAPSRGSNADDKAMRDDELESQIEVMSSNSIQVREEFMRAMRKKLRLVADETMTEVGGGVVRLVEEAERSNDAMDSRGWFVPRTILERESAVWDPEITSARLAAEDNEEDGDKVSPAQRESEKFNACPSLVLLGDEYTVEDWPTTLRQLGYAHGLRGATSDASETFDMIRQTPQGPNVVLASGGLSYSALKHSVQTLKDKEGHRLTESPTIFLVGVVKDPMTRAIETYLQYGLTQRGWTPTVENVKDFMFGKFGRAAHVHNIQFKTLAPQSMVDRVLQSERKLSADLEETPSDDKDAVTDEEVLNVMNIYDLLATPEYELEARMFLKQMLYRIVGVRQLILPPKIGYAKLDRYGFPKLSTKDGMKMLPRDVKDFLSSEEFTSAFIKFNEVDYKLYLGASERMLRMWDGHRKVGTFLQWREAIADWVKPRFEATEGFKTASQLGSSPPRQATKCDIGKESECSSEFEAKSASFVAEAGQTYNVEDCLYENQGCFSRAMINLGLEQYKDSRRTALGSWLTNGDNDQFYGTRSATKCAERAFEENFKTCPDAETFGPGLLGKSIVALSDIIYLICAGDSCEKMCVPESWASKARVVDGVKVDECMRIPIEVSHFRRATITHGAVIAHAQSEKKEHAAVIEFDAYFVDPKDQKYNSSAALESVAALITETRLESDLKFTILRLGYRAWEFENGRDSCPHGCGCRYSPHSTDGPFCMVTRTQCDLRGSHAYILSQDAYVLFLEPVLAKTSSNRIIDFNIFQRFPQQVILTPMLALQAVASSGADYIAPQRQTRDGLAFEHACRVY